MYIFFLEVMQAFNAKAIVVLSLYKSCFLYRQLDGTALALCNRTHFAFKYIAAAGAPFFFVFIHIFKK